MGTPAYSNGYVQFDTTENALNAFKSFDKWVDAKNALKDEHYGIYDLEFENSNAGVKYTVDSTRFENCQWQCENIREFFKVQVGVKSITQDILILEDSVNWTPEDEDEDDDSIPPVTPSTDKFMEDERGA
jgi:hypothetical protein